MNDTLSSLEGGAGLSAWIDPDKDLLAQGVDQPVIVKMLQSVQKDFGIEIPIAEFLKEPTLARLRSIIRERKQPKDTASPLIAPAIAEQPSDDMLRAWLREAEIPQEVDLDRDLFAQGLTSLAVLRVLSRARIGSGVQVDLDEFLARPTMRRLAELCSGTAAGQAVAERPASAPGSEAAGAAARPGILCDEGEKRRFLAARHNLRRIDKTAVVRAGDAAPGESFQAEYERRRSRRTFGVSAVACEDLLRWLSCLRSAELGGVSRTLYPSAGGTYAVQIYVEVKEGAIRGVDRGFYYYHPLRHALCKLSDGTLSSSAHFFYNRPVYERAGFCVYLVAEYAGIEPIYGQQSERFVAIEAGCIAQLLMERQSQHNKIGRAHV